jgi:hypothetical protein
MKRECSIKFGENSGTPVYVYVFETGSVNCIGVIENGLVVQKKAYIFKPRTRQDLHVNWLEDILYLLKRLNAGKKITYSLDKRQVGELLQEALNNTQ